MELGAVVSGFVQLLPEALEVDPLDIEFLVLKPSEEALPKFRSKRERGTGEAGRPAPQQLGRLPDLCQVRCDAAFGGFLEACWLRSQVNKVRKHAARMLCREGTFVEGCPALDAAFRNKAWLMWSAQAEAACVRRNPCMSLWQDLSLRLASFADHAEPLRTAA